MDISGEQIQKILSPERARNCISSSLDEIHKNPYILAEEFVGDNVDDTISFNRIDHGMIPSPELGLQSLAENNDCRRFRALVVERLRRESVHSFLSQTTILTRVNKKLESFQEWKRVQFSENYFTVDLDHYEKALVFREYDKEKYIYLKSVYESERIIEKILRDLAKRPGIRLPLPCF